MRHGSQKPIAIKVGISPSFLCRILNGNQRPSWMVAKKLSKATNTNPELWLEGTPEQMRQAIGAEIITTHAVR